MAWVTTEVVHGILAQMCSSSAVGVGRQTKERYSPETQEDWGKSQESQGKQNYAAHAADLSISMMSRSTRATWYEWVEKRLLLKKKSDK